MGHLSSQSGQIAQWTAAHVEPLAFFATTRAVQELRCHLRFPGGTLVSPIIASILEAVSPAVSASRSVSLMILSSSSGSFSTALSLVSRPQDGQGVACLLTEWWRLPVIIGFDDAVSSTTWIRYAAPTRPNARVWRTIRKSTIRHFCPETTS